MIALLLILGIILFVVWLLGLILEFIVGPALWVLLAAAIVFMLIWFVRRVVTRT